MADNDGATTIEVDLSDASIAKLTKAIADAIGKGAQQGANSMGATFTKAANKAADDFANQWAKTFRQNAGRLTDAIENTLRTATSKAMNGAFDAAMFRQMQVQLGSVKGISQSVLDPATIKRAAGLSAEQLGVFTKGLDMELSQAWAHVQAFNTHVANAGRERTAQIKVDGKMRAIAESQAGKLEAIEARKAADIVTAQSRQAGEMRVATHKALLKTITMLERGIGTAIKGTAKTTLSVVSSMTSGVGSLLRRHNSDAVSGLSGAYDKREKIMRDSFNDQEGIIRRSALRQQAELTKIREQTSRGVLGTVTGRGLGMGVGALVGGFGAIAWLKDGYTQAVNLNEQLNKTNVVFGSMAGQVVAFSETAVNSLGATQAEALTAAGTFGNLFRSVKLSEQQSAEMSMTLVKLAADLSSFNNVPVDEVFDALRSGLVGEQEPLRRLGVNLNEATLKVKAFELGLSDGKSVLSANAKAQAAYALILEQTTLAQGDFARTMYEGANAQRRAGKAAKELATEIMGKLMPAITVGMNAATTAFTGLTTLLSDRTNPVLHTLQRTLMGVAAGMGAVIAMKGAVEVLKLMGTAVKLSLGPMGLLLTTAGLIGGAISLMMDRSEAFRTTMGLLGDRFAAIGHAIGKVFEPILRSAGNLLDNVIIPAIDRTATWLGNHLLPAFDAVVSFVKRNVRPTLEAARNVITGVGDAVVRVGSAIEPYLRPAIDGFKALGAAISAAFGGDFGGLGAGLASAGSGIVGSLSMVLGRVGDLLAPLAQKVAKFVVDLFSGPNLMKYAKAFLGFVETIGRVLGTIVSHPTFVKAVVGIGAAAVVIGAKLAQGILEGIISNLPGLWDLLTSALAAGLSLAFKNAWKVALVVLGGLVLGTQLKNVFHRGGEAAGSGFFAGFKKKVGDGRQFLSGLFGGTGTADPRAAAALKRQYQLISNQMAALGAPRISTGFRALDKATVDAATKQLELLKSKFTESEIAGRMAAYKIQQAWKGTSGFFTGVVKGVGSSLAVLPKAAKGAAAGVAAALATTNAYSGAGTGGGRAFTGAFAAQVKGSGEAIKGAFKGAWASMTDYAKNTGQSVGAVLGGALAKGAIAAAAAAGGFMAGKAEGQSGGSGLMSAIIGGVGAGAMIGGPWGAAVGALVGGASLIGAAFGRAEAAAKKFREEVAQLAAEFTDSLNKAIEDGVIKLGQITDGLTFGEVLSVDLEGVKAQIADALGPAGRKMVADLGLTIEADLLPLLRRAGGDAEKAGQLLSQSLIDATARSRDLGGALEKDVVKILKDIAGPGGMSTIDDWLARQPNTNLGVAKWIKENRVYLNSVLDNAKALAGEAKAMSIAAQEASDLAAVMAAAPDSSSAWSSWVAGPLGAAEDVKTALAEAQGARDRLDLRLSLPLPTPGVSDFKAAMDAAVLALDDAGESAASIAAKSQQNGLPEAQRRALEAQMNQLKGSITGQWSNAINQGIADGTIKTRADLDKALLELAAITAEGGGKIGEGLSYEMLQALGPEFADLLADKLEADGDLAGAALMRGLAAGISENVYNAVQSAIDAAAKVHTAMRGEFQIASPSKLFAKMGGQLTTGLALGITKGAQEAVAAAERMAAAVAAGSSLPAAAFAGRPGAAGAGGGTSLTDQRQFNNHLYLPTGDPEAAALAVVNRQASSLWG